MQQIDGRHATQETLKCVAGLDYIKSEAGHVVYPSSKQVHARTHAIVHMRVHKCMMPNTHTHTPNAGCFYYTGDMHVLLKGQS